MSVEFLVHARSHKIYQKGAISQTVKDSPAIWGRMETLPDYVRVTVSDATIDDIGKYNQQWIEKFIVKDSPSKIIIERADAGRIKRINLTNAKVERFKKDLQALGVTRSDVALVNGDIEINKGVVTLQQVQSIVYDIESLHNYRRFHIKNAVIDNLVNQGKDSVTITLAQLEKNLVDGLD